MTVILGSRVVFGWHRDQSPCLSVLLAARVCVGPTMSASIENLVMHRTVPMEDPTIQLKSLALGRGTSVMEDVRWAKV